MEGSEFLKEKFQLQKNAEVQQATKRTKERTGEVVQQTAEAQIENYLQRFDEIVQREDIKDRERGIEALKKVLHKHNIVDHVPESYLELQRRILREAGRSDEIPDEFPEEEMTGYLKTIQEDQRSSLDSWVDELAQTGDEFPGWAKYWAIRSMLKMGPYDKQKHQFSKRTKSTAAPYPDLNQEALAVSIDYLMKHLADEKIDNPVKSLENVHTEEGQEEKLVSDENFIKIVQSQDFAKYYAFAIEHVTADNSELFKITDGEWRTYSQGSDPELLVKSIQGHGTGWCTAGSYTAAEQLKDGGFHVFYSLNSLGEATIPRLAILMNGDKIDEVRGVAYRQEIDPYISPVLDGRLQEFGHEGEEWQKKSSNMQRLTELDEKNQRSEEFTSEELRFLWEIDERIEGFGYGDDPRIKELQESRDRTADFRQVFPNHGVTEDPTGWSEDTELLIGDITVTSDLQLPDSLKYIEGEVTIESGTNETALRLLKTNKASNVENGLGKFSGLKSEVIDSMGFGRASAALDNLESFELNEQQAITEKLSRNGIARMYCHDLAAKLEKFTNIDTTKLANTFYEVNQGNLVIEFAQKFFPELPDAKQEPMEYFTGLKSYLENISDQVLLESIFNSDLPEVHKMIVQTLESHEIDDQQRLVEILARKNPEYLLQNLSLFSDINQIKLLDRMCPQEEFENEFGEVEKRRGFEEVVVKHIDAFVDLEPQMIVDRLLETPEMDIQLTENIHRYHDLAIDHNAIASSLLENENEDVLCKNLLYFKNLSSKIAENLISTNSISDVFDNLYSFERLDRSVAELIVDEYPDYVRYVIDNLNYFDGLDHMDVVEVAMRGGKDGLEDVVSNFKRFVGIDSKEILDRIFSKGYEKLLAYNLNEFRNLEQSVAEKLIAAGYLTQVVGSAASFQSLDYERVLSGLQKAGQETLIARHLEHFPNVDQAALAKKLVADGNSRVLVEQAKKFTNLSTESITDMLIAAGDTDIIAQNVDRLSNVNHQAAAEDLIKNGQIDFLIRNLYKYTEANHSMLVEQMINAGESWKIATNLNVFQDIDQSHIAQVLIANGKIGAVAQHIEKFTQLNSEDHKMIAEKLIADKKGKWVATNITKFAKLNESDKQEILAGC